MTKILALLLLGAAATASAQVYRWVDEKGRVHYSNAAPPAGVKATIVDAEAKAGPPTPETQDCHTLRCQGERLEPEPETRRSIGSAADAHLEHADACRDPDQQVETVGDDGVPRPVHLVNVRPTGRPPRPTKVVAGAA